MNFICIMLSRRERMIAALQSLNPQFLEIWDDSGKHAGHAGVKGSNGETHFKVEIASLVFNGKSRVACHRMIQDLLKPEFEQGLHALQIHIKTIP